jgi:dihydropteroate synthase
MVVLPAPEAPSIATTRPDAVRPPPDAVRDRGLGKMVSLGSRGRRYLSPGRLPGDVSDTPAHEPPAHRFGARVLDWDRLSEIAREIERTESDPEGVGIMTRKGRIFPVWLSDIPLKASPLIKQELLSVGGDAAHARGVADHSVRASSVLLLATWGQYRRLLPKLRRQPFHLREVADEVDRALREYVAHGTRTVEGAHRSLTLGDRPRVMGVVNVTPDSFSDGGKFLEPPAAIAAALQMVEDGASVIDVGGESTRPGATPISPEAEWARLEPVLDGLRGRLTVPLSVDTRHAEVAAKAVAAGADLVNDVEGLRSEEMRRVVARSGAAALVMHMRGTPTTMQQDLEYADLRAEVFRALADGTDTAIRSGIPAEKLLVDPGLGFGKSADQSLELLVHVGELRSLGYPVVVGASRKSFLGAALDPGAASERLEAGIAAAVIAAERGVALVRTHDVGATVRALALVAAADRLAGRPPKAPGALASVDADE